MVQDLIAYCSGTGGSMLVIGSAAGIAYMGLEDVSFSWYLKRVSPSAVAGYIAGIGTLPTSHSPGPRQGCVLGCCVVACHFQAASGALLLIAFAITKVYEQCSLGDCKRKDIDLATVPC